MEESDLMNNIFRSSEETSEGEAERYQDKLQQFIQSITPDNLQSKGMELISIARDSIDEIVHFIRHPKELLRLFTQSLSPDTFYHFKSSFPNGMRSELQEFLRNSFEIQEEEFQEMLLPFHELLAEVETLMSQETFERLEMGTDEGSFFSEMISESGDLKTLDEITGESMQEMLKLFHDPQQVHS
jgi:hypothetical protein